MNKDISKRLDNIEKQLKELNEKQSSHIPYYASPYYFPYLSWWFFYTSSNTEVFYTKEDL